MFFNFIVLLEISPIHHYLPSYHSLYFLGIILFLFLETYIIIFNANTFFFYSTPLTNIMSKHGILMNGVIGSFITCVCCEV